MDIHGHQLTRTVYAHGKLYAIARDALARGTESSYRSEFLTAIVMAAFAMESYIGFAAEEKLRFWKHLDRLPVQSKMDILTSACGIAIDHGAEPWQTVRLARRVRDQVAHARTESMTEIRAGAPVEPIVYPETDWEKECTVERAKAVVERVYEAMEELHEKLGLRHGHPGTPESQGGEILRKSP